MAKIVRENGTIRACIITPGHGTSGYYSPALLEKSAGKFGGVQVYWDHPTSQEEAIRPERSLRDLAGKVLPGTAVWEGKNPLGAGVYADVQVYKPYQSAVEELGPDIGMSIRASGRASQKMVDGKESRVIESIEHVSSVDFVTLPGRGGKPLQLFEAARQAGRQAALRETTTTTHQQEQSMAEDQKLTEALAEIKKLKERAAVSDAAGAVAEYFRSVRVPSQAIVERVTARVLAGSIPLTEAGDLDRKKVKEFAEAQLNEELNFLKSVNPSLVTGMGSPTTQMSEADREKHQKKERKAMKESSKRFASVMGFGGDEHKVARKILREGRGAFDPNFNARTKGVQISGDLGSIGLEA